MNKSEFIREYADKLGVTIKEAEDFKAHPENYKRYSSFAELLKEVEEDA